MAFERRNGRPGIHSPCSAALAPDLEQVSRPGTAGEGPGDQASIQERFRIFQLRAPTVAWTHCRPPPSRGRPLVVPVKKGIPALDHRAAHRSRPLRS